ncbi:MAG TPA: hypothetical protein PK598_14730, partial [Thermoanaerobaculia bacterium]|nr:hypothetical protein [Thermoanaerobaculia bacterium]
MIGLVIVHGAYVPELSQQPLSGFLLWGEGTATEVGPSDRHPRALEAEALEEALRPLGLGGMPGAVRATTASVALPSRGGWALAP